MKNLLKQYDFYMACVAIIKTQGKLAGGEPYYFEKGKRHDFEHLCSCEMALPSVAGILSKWTPDSKEAVCPDKGTPGRSQGSPAKIVSIFLMLNRLS